jgi:hypothetical protein
LNTTYVCYEKSTATNFSFQINPDHAVQNLLEGVMYNNLAAQCTHAKTYIFITIFIPVTDVPHYNSAV